MPDGQEQEVYCFLNFSRPCTAECVAYETTAPDGVEYRDKAWSHCMLAINVHRVGRHLPVLANAANSMMKHFIDQARTPPPPRSP